MRDSGLAPDVTQDGNHVELRVPHGERGEFRYAVRARAVRAASFAFAETRRRESMTTAIIARWPKARKRISRTTLQAILPTS